MGYAHYSSQIIIAKQAVEVMNASAKQRTENPELVELFVRLETIEKRGDAQQNQMLDISNKLGGFGANLATVADETRRNHADMGKTMQSFKEFNENQTTAVLKSLETITEALGLDGTPYRSEKLREALKKLQKSDNRREQLYSKLTEHVFLGAMKWILVFVVGAVILRLGINIPTSGIIP